MDQPNERPDSSEEEDDSRLDKLTQDMVCLWEVFVNQYVRREARENKVLESIVWDALTMNGVVDCLLSRLPRLWHITSFPSRTCARTKTESSVGNKYCNSMKRETIGRKKRGIQADVVPLAINVPTTKQRKKVYCKHLGAERRINEKISSHQGTRWQTVMSPNFKWRQLNWFFIKLSKKKWNIKMIT